MAEHRLSPGSPEPLGISLEGDGINIAVFSAHATALLLCLFDEQDHETARIRLPERAGDIFHGHIGGIRPGQRYGLRAEGPHAPREGHRFNVHKLLLDPHATVIDRPFQLHLSMFGYEQGHPDADLSFDDTDSAPHMPKAIVTALPASLAQKAVVPWNRTIIYEMHVRGFSKLHPKVPEAMRGTFAGMAHKAPLAHLSNLGVTSVELLPVAAWLDERHLGPLGLTNYWGYNPVAFCAVDPRLAPGGWDEVRASVRNLEKAGIETILDVVLNHTGEGDELGPTVSLRGLDNATYYRLDGSNPRLYANDAGCGNTLALERPAPLRLAMDALRRFAELGGIHGFRFDLATTLARRATGFDAEHPFLAAIGQDPVLSRLKLIAEPWDIGMGGYQLGQFPSQWGEWNDRYRDTTRRFWRGEAGLLGEMATRLAGSADVFAARNRPLSRSINFITAHDGFTLADLVSHEHKHNEANGENNRDGTNANHSWNHGHEGSSDAESIKAARMADQRALLATLLLSRGTPMLTMGDELGHTQQGNNNAYAQDNALSWLDWGRADSSLIAHTKKLIAARLGNPALWSDKPLSGLPTDANGIPDVEWLRADGEAMRSEDWENPHNRLLVASLHAAWNGECSRAVVAINAGADAADVMLPEPGEGHGWADPDGHVLVDTICRVLPRSVMWLVEVPSNAKARRAGVDPAALRRLSDAAGIAPEWWDVSGRHKAVSPDTQKALLAAMRLPATTTGDARASLMRLVDERDQRALPASLVCTADEPLSLNLPLANGRQLALVIDSADEGSLDIPIAPGAGETIRHTGVDGRENLRRRIALPGLPAGRYRLVLENQDDEACHLIVAPRRCWQPSVLNRPRFGISAHLYTLRRTGDQGIGDFTTLAEFGAAAAVAGAVTLGLNPLHALFSQNRERASPYHPNDRRFLDPIYLDVGSNPFARMPTVREAMERHQGLFARLSGRDNVDYSAIWQAKREVLSAAFDGMQKGTGDAVAALRAEFAGFVEQGGEDLQHFAAFETISDQHRGLPWQHWPEALRDAEPAAVNRVVQANSKDMRFALFQQWLCDRALADAVSRTGLELGIYRDLAVGSAPDGAEAWAGQQRFASGVSIGAPPDPFSVDGQVWCLPAPDPLALKRDGYQAFGRMLAANMRHAGALRIDHAMGLQRLFWVPDGASARDGAYIGYDLAEQLGVLAFESQRAQCLVIGEDLGTVPDGFREAMERTGVMSYRVLSLEREGEAFRQPVTYPKAAAACIGTHDLPTLTGWWIGSDIAEMAAMGMISPDTAGEHRQRRETEKHELFRAMSEAGLEPEQTAEMDDALAALIHRYLAQAPSTLMLVQADDLAGDETRINLPGTDRERPNWRRKLKPDSAELLSSSRARAILSAISRRTDAGSSSRRP
jgi:glycogen debranching enzyme GlgX/4-alpha-glucanotransferase